ncbi:MAG: UDP-N-acetylmuramoyl-L-alanine--D-glutamate ligase [Rhodothermales bacterium]
MRKDVTGKRVTVVGGARSGVSAARLLARAGAAVFLTESGQLRDSIRESLREANVDFEEGGHTPRALEADFVVVSPGVAHSAPLYRSSREKGLPIYSEIEIASWFCRAPIAAVTGSNGKTTTTSLLGHVFRHSGRRTFVGGNIGTAFADFAADAQPDDVVVLEVSSFQLDDIEGFRPRVSMLLNITPDHLDRYEHDLGRYQESKFRVFENQGEGDTFIYNFDDPVVRERTMRLAEERPALEILGFSQEAALDAGAFLRGGEVVLRVKKEEVLMRAEEISLQGRHNLYNTLAAAVAARVMEVRSDSVRESLMSFEGVPHRLEFVRELDGVRYVNDSKATNVNAVWYALESFREPVVLIAGGRDKGNDYSSLKPLLREKARAVIAIGESASKVAAELGPEVRQHAEAETMEDALRYARLFAEPGDVVLLSPACASFDMFENYEERGEVFKRLVNDL